MKSLLLLALLTARQAPVQAVPTRNNLALGRPCRLEPRPNYSYCTDRDDRTQLTDGIHSKGYFWTQKETVGWVRANPVLITIDLGREAPIGGISFRTAFGTAGVHPPEAIFVFVGKDRKSWRFLGDLVTLSDIEGGAPPDRPYRVHTYKSTKTAGTGRYVLLGVLPRGSFVFCDEIEVYRGGKNLAQETEGPPIKDVMAWIQQRRVSHAFENRLRTDLETVILSARKADPGIHAALEALAPSLAEYIPREATHLPPDFRAVVPATPLHERILSLHSLVLSGVGIRKLTAWHTNRYAPLDYLAAPPRKARPELSAFLMRGEYRAEVLNLTNPLTGGIDAWITITGLPGEPAPPWIRVHLVLFVDTSSRKPVADALQPVPRRGGAWKVRIPAGITSQVWFTFHPLKVPPGDYQGTIRVNSRGETLLVPLTVHVSPLRFPPYPRLSLGLWDYTDDPPSYDITPRNRPAAIADMKAHFVDSPWAHRKVLPWPPASAFDGKDRLNRRLDFGAFDKWTKLWPGARNYCVFLSVGNGSFAGFPPGHPRFARRVGAWAGAVEKHLRKIGIDPGRLAFLILDEPRDRKKDALILAWARAIEAACPSFVIWEDPTHRRPEKDGLKAMFEACDILCPNLGIFASGSPESRRFYLDLVREGKRKLWFYQCAGPVRELDPYFYNRLQAWYSWKYGAVGSGFWAYADSSKTPWNAYRAPRNIYSPVYIEADRVVDGKHFEAVREGIEDFEYLALLEDKIRTSSDPSFRKRARSLLERARVEVVPGYDSARIQWRTSKDYAAADRIRLLILSLLEGKE